MADSLVAKQKSQGPMFGQRPQHLTVLNCRVRTRTHGGMGGRSREASSYPELRAE